MPTAEELAVKSLGPCRIDSPLRPLLESRRTTAHYVAERGQKIAVVGIPKTIDNDIPYIDQSFGFQTAFGEAAKSIRAAHVEAKASPNGVGLVKLMGRHSGFIACYAAFPESDANYVLIPEVPFRLDGDLWLAVLEATGQPRVFA